VALAYVDKASDRTAKPATSDAHTTKSDFVVTRLDGHP